MESVSRLPAEGGTTSELLSTFSVTVSEAMMPHTVNTPQYTFATYGGHSYVLASSRSWTDADAYAVSLGGHLVTIIRSANRIGCYTTLASQNPNPWIGLNDATTEGTGLWTSGEAVTYTDWAWSDSRTTTMIGGLRWRSGFMV